MQSGRKGKVAPRQRSWRGGLNLSGVGKWGRMGGGAGPNKASQTEGTVGMEGEQSGCSLVSRQAELGSEMRPRREGVGCDRSGS